MRRRIIILGAAGRDFHNFNTVYRNNPDWEVVAFTAAQIPNIDDRIYPPELAGSLYPMGIPIYSEANLVQLIKDLKVEACVFSYSDVPYTKVMSTSAVVNATGADFILLGHQQSMIKSKKPVIAIGAVRTGCGKSQTSRKIIEILINKGLKVVAVRHPMPYGKLAEQKVQRFATLADLEKHHCTIEEMEEYEPHVVRGNVIYSGIDYEAILKAAENDPNGCDIIVWDGGNNDFPFFKPDLMFTVLDPHRPGHELSYYPGEVCLRLANVAIINKMDSAELSSIQIVKENIIKTNPNAIVVAAESPIFVDSPELIKDKKVLVIEDGPTLTHGEMKTGAGLIAASKYGAKEIIDPRPYLSGSLVNTFKAYPNIGTLLPAMGYNPSQLNDLEKTINSVPCDIIIMGTPIDLNRIIKIQKPTVRVSYELQEIGEPSISTILDEFFKK